MRTMNTHCLLCKEQRNGIMKVVSGRLCDYVLSSGRCEWLNFSSKMLCLAGARFHTMNSFLPIFCAAGAEIVVALRSYWNKRNKNIRSVLLMVTSKILLLIHLKQGLSEDPTRHSPLATRHSPPPTRQTPFTIPSPCWCRPWRSVNASKKIPLATRHLPLPLPPLTRPILLRNHFIHSFVVHFTFHPWNDIEIGKGTGLEAVFFEVLDGV